MKTKIDYLGNFSKSEIKRICKAMVEKDFEIISAKSIIYKNLLSGHENFEIKNQLTSIKHVFELATKDCRKDKDSPSFFETILVASHTLALHKMNTKNSPKNKMSRNVDDLVNLIFDTSMSKTDKERQAEFIRGFITLFPNYSKHFLTITKI